jgi:hypothetical protein
MPWTDGCEPANYTLWMMKFMATAANALPRLAILECQNTSVGRRYGRMSVPRRGWRGAPEDYLCNEESFPVREPNLSRARN